MVVKQFLVYEQNSGKSYQKSIKTAESLQDFKNKIKFWTPLNFAGKLFKTYIANVSYVSVFSFTWFQFPNLLNVSMYDSSTSVMV